MQNNWLPIRRRTRLALIPVILASALLVLGCGRYDVQSSSELAELTESADSDHSPYPTLIMVTPQLVIEHEPYQAYQFAADVVELLTLEGDVSVVAPWEYDREGDLDASSAPQVALMAISDETTISLTDLAVLELRIEGSYTSTSVQTPLQMGGGYEHHYRSDVSVTLAVRQFPYGRELARVEVQFEDDPLTDEATAANPHPITREGVREATRELVALLEDAFGEGPTSGIPDMELLANHRLMFTYQAGTDRSLAEDLASMDELDRLVAENVYYQYFNPDISGSTLRLFESTEPGILVRSVAGAFAGVLMPGDYITTVEEDEAAGVQVLYRRFLLAPAQRVEVEVLRDGRIHRLRLPVLQVD